MSRLTPSTNSFRIDHASKEVNLSADAVEIPELLMLFGINDAIELTQHSIETLHHHPGVGKNLQDRLFATLCWKQKDSDMGWAQHYSNPDAVQKAHEKFHEQGTGPQSSLLQGLTMGFFKAYRVLQTTEFGSFQRDD